jgi:hypothetical protein
MLNNSTVANFRRTDSLMIAYYPLFLVIIGTGFNLLTFIILCRSTFNNSRRQATIYYMRAIAIFDILMLYGWNLDHYILNVYGILLQRYSIVLCKILSFLNYFSGQSSAWLRVFMCLDRYICLSHLHPIWFNQSKNVLITIICIITFFALFNFHIILFACFYTNKGRISVNARRYKIYPLWDYINLGLYNCTPFILMVIFNSGVIYHLIHIRFISSIPNSRIHHRAISITLVLTTFLFLLMTIPATVSFAFFYTTASVTVLHLLDSILYTYHILSFPLYLITFNEFRQECRAMLTYKNNRRIASILPRSSPYVINKP